MHEAQHTHSDLMLSSRVLVFLACLAVGASHLCAQDTTDLEVPAVGALSRVNGEWERYWRVLQVAGIVPTHPWSTRPLGTQELRRLGARRDHPWADREAGRQLRLGFVRAATIPLEVRTIFNTAFPFGFNEGPVWAGRGLTTVLGGGAWVTAGPLTASLAPVLFQSQNRSFELFPNGFGGAYAFGFPYSNRADMPQRFGDTPYARADAGNSFIRLDAGVIAAGLSTAAQHWGPARDHPPILGSNAGGFPHVFLGSARPVRVGPLRVHGKLMWGRLSQSSYTDMNTIERHRLAVGVVGLVVPVNVPGLELGAARFAQMLWTDDVFRAGNLLRPFGRTFGDGIKAGASNAENQMASIFARWVFPESGVEVYGEFANEDGALTIRNLTLEPDHDAGYVLGAQRTWSGGRDRRTGQRHVVRGEVLNTRIMSVRLIPLEVPFYEHNIIRQGHTHRGHALGSAGGFGGGATSLAYDRYSPAGRWSVTWTRLMRAQFVVEGVPTPSRADVFHALGVDGVLFRGRTALTYEMTGVYEPNRNFRSDAFNVRFGIGSRFTW